VKSATTATAALRTEKSNIVDLVPQHLTENDMELPRINYKYNGKDYQYFYGLQPSKPTGNYEFGMNVISKVNVKTGEKRSWTLDENCMLSEPIFVPDPTKPNGEEDDGVILAAVLPNDSPKSISLLILNASDMTEIGRTNFSALGGVPGTFHGEWAQTGEKVHTY
jgi:carotenoid cleavage dioxygenase-like enzyme